MCNWWGNLSSFQHLHVYKLHKFVGFFLFACWFFLHAHTCNYGKTNRQLRWNSRRLFTLLMSRQWHWPAAGRPSAGGMSHTPARTTRAGCAGTTRPVSPRLYWGTAGSGAATAPRPPGNPEPHQRPRTFMCVCVCRQTLCLVTVFTDGETVCVTTCYRVHPHSLSVRKQIVAEGSAGKHPPTVDVTEPRIIPWCYIYHRICDEMYFFMQLPGFFSKKYNQLSCCYFHLWPLSGAKSLLIMWLELVCLRESPATCWTECLDIKRVGLAYQ